MQKSFRIAALALLVIGLVANSVPSVAQVNIGNGGSVLVGSCGTGFPCAISQGGTGATTAPDALANLGGWMLPIFVGTAPSGACSPNDQIAYLTNSVPYAQYTCISGTWVQTGGAGSASFSAITNGINTTAAMLVGSGASLGVTGSGTIAATSVNHSLTLTNALASPTSQTFNGSAAITQNLIDPSQTGAQTMQGPLEVPALTDSALVNSTNVVTVLSFTGGSGYTSASIAVSGGTCSILPAYSIALAGSPPSSLVLTQINPGTCTAVPTATITGTGGVGAAVTLGYAPAGVTATSGGTLAVLGSTTGWGGGVNQNNPYIEQPYLTNPVIESGASGNQLLMDCGSNVYLPLLTGNSDSAYPRGNVIEGGCDQGIGIDPTDQIFPQGYFGDAYQFFDVLSVGNTSFNALNSFYANFVGSQTSNPAPQGTDWYETLNAQEVFAPNVTTFGGAGNGTGYSGSGTCTLSGGTLLSGGADTCSVTAVGGGLLFTITQNGLYSAPNTLTYSWSGSGSGANTTEVALSGPPSSTPTGSIWMDPAGTFHVSHAGVPTSTSSANDTFSVTAAGLPKFPGIAGASTYCLQISSTGQLSNTSAACGTSSGGTNVALNGGSSLTSLAMTGFMPQACSDTSGSGSAQSCSTANTFVPQANNCVVYSTTTANSGTSLTVNINSLGAKSVAVPSSSGWTTTLTASSSIPSGKPMHLCYDGTNWDASATGYQASGSGVSSFSGDGGILSNVTSTGAVTVTLKATAAGTIPDSTSAGNASWTPTPTLGVQNATAGSLTLAGGTLGAGTLTLCPSGSGPTCATETAVNDGGSPLLYPNGSGGLGILPNGTISGASIAAYEVNAYPPTTLTPIGSFLSWTVGNTNAVATTTLTGSETLDLVSLASGSMMTLFTSGSGYALTGGTGCTWLVGNPSSGYAASTTLIASTHSYDIVSIDYDGTYCRTSTGIPATATNFSGSLSGDVTGTQSATSVVKVNGASLPASKTIVGTNSSGQIVDASSATLANNTSGNAATATNISTNGTAYQFWGMNAAATAQQWENVPSISVPCTSASTDATIINAALVMGSVKVVPTGTCDITASLVLQNYDWLDTSQAILTGGVSTTATGMITDQASVSPVTTSRTCTLTQGSSPPTIALTSCSAATFTSADVEQSMSCANALGTGTNLQGVIVNYVSSSAVYLSPWTTSTISTGSYTCTETQRTHDIRITAGTVNHTTTSGTNNLVLRSVNRAVIEGGNWIGSTGDWADVVADADYVTFRDNKIQNNSDGLHWLGPLNHVRDENGECNTADDCNAFDTGEYAGGALIYGFGGTINDAYADVHGAGNSRGVWIGPFAINASGSTCVFPLISNVTAIVNGGPTWTGSTAGLAGYGGFIVPVQIGTGSDNGCNTAPTAVVADNIWAVSPKGPTPLGVEVSVDLAINGTHFGHIAVLNPGDVNYQPVTIVGYSNSAVSLGSNSGVTGTVDELEVSGADYAGTYPLVSSANIAGSMTITNLYSDDPKPADFNFTGVTITNNFAEYAWAPATGGPFCMQITSAGKVTNTGSACGSGGGGTTTNPLTAAATGGASPGTTFNGSAAVTFDYHSFGAQAALGYTPANCTAGTTGSDCLQLASGLVPAANLPSALSSSSSLGTSCTINSSTTVTGVCGANTNTLNDGSGNAAITGKIAAANMKDTGVTASSFACTDSTSTFTATCPALPAVSIAAGTGMTSSQVTTALGYTPANCTPGTSGSDCLTLSSGLVPVANLPASVSITRITFGNSTTPGSAVPTGTTPSFTSPIAGTIISATLTGTLSAGTCSAVIDVWKTSAAIPTVSNTITASDLPTLSGARYYQDTSLTSWTKTVAKNDVLMANVNSATCDNWNLVLAVQQ